MKFGDESKHGSAGTGTPVTGSLYGYIEALKVNPSWDEAIFTIAAFLQQLFQVKCHPSAGGIPDSWVGGVSNTYSSTAPRSPFAQLYCWLPLLIGSHNGETSCWEIKFAVIVETVGCPQTLIVCAKVETVIPAQSLYTLRVNT